MKNTKFISKVMFALIAALGTSAFASNTADETVTMNVSAINEIAVPASLTLTVNAATAGLAPTAVTNGAPHTISWTTNGTGKKITAILDSAMPSGLTLKVRIILNGGQSGQGTAASAGGLITLSNVAADLVTGVANTASGQDDNLEYELSATPAFAPTGGTPVVRTVTFTLA